MSEVVTPRFYIADTKQSPWYIHHGIPKTKFTWVGWTLDHDSAETAVDILNSAEFGHANVHLRSDFKEYPRDVAQTILKHEVYEVNLVALVRT